MRTFLICHENEEINREILPRWLNSFSTLAGVLAIEEKPGRMVQRVKKEMKRVGPFRFLDVFAFRFFYGAFLSRQDLEWEQEAIRRHSKRYPEIPAATPILRVHSPNTPEARAFIEKCAPDLMIARCKFLLKREVFRVPSLGTFVMHPGICPEYRNAHGCFWALASGDYDNVGMTLLKIDEGVDTGPVYGFFRVPYDAGRESHVVIQLRTVFDNLDEIQATLERIAAGQAKTIDTAGHPSKVWGQPWLSAYLRVRREAVRRPKIANDTAVP